MNLYSFHVPGETQHRYVEAETQEQAEAQAVYECLNHSFLGGAVRPPVFLEGQVLPDGKIKLPNGFVIEE